MKMIIEIDDDTLDNNILSKLEIIFKFETSGNLPYL